jgi:hypothetical protein
MICILDTLAKFVKEIILLTSRNAVMLGSNKSSTDAGTVDKSKFEMY